MRELSQEEVEERIEACRRMDYTDLLKLRRLRKFERVAASEDEDSSEDDDSSDSEDDEDDGYETYPITHEFTIHTGDQRVTALEVEDPGIQFVVGSQDSTVKLFHYNHLQLNKYKAFHSQNPFKEEINLSEFGATSESGNYVITGLVSDRKSHNLLVIPNYSIFKILDTNGTELWKLPRGDIYLQDYSLTKGHVNVIEDGLFEDDEVITCGRDATIRTWSLAKERQVSVAYYRDLRRARTSVDNIAYCGNSKKNLVSTDSSGTISIYDINNLQKPLQAINKTSRVFSLVVNNFSKNQIVTRSVDNELNVYDLRKFDSPISTRTQFEHSNEYQNLAISNDGTKLIAATNEDSKYQLQMMDLNDLSTKYTLNLQEEPTCIKWDYEINQILYGDVKGNVHTLFGNAKVSTRGIRYLFTKPAAKRPRDEDLHMYYETHSLNSEEMNRINKRFRDED